MNIIFNKFKRDLYSELPKIAVSILIISMGIGGFITFFQVSDNIKITVDSQYDELRLGDAWINLQPIPIPTPEELIEYSRNPEIEGINDAISQIEVMQPRLHLYGKSEGENGKIIIEILGLPQEQHINKLRITEGEDLSAKAEEGNIPVVIESRFEKYHGYGLGDTFNLTIVKINQDTIEFETINVTAEVMGIAVSAEYFIITGNQGVFVPRQSTIGVMFVDLLTLQNITGFDGMINQVSIVSESGVHELFDGTPLENVIISSYSKENMESYMILNNDQKGVKQVTPKLAGIWLVIAGCTISLNLYRIIQSQKKEIGVMRAMGMDSNKIMQFYTWYGVFIGIIGAIGGIVAGLGISLYITYQYSIATEIPGIVYGLSPTLVLLGIFLSMFSSLIFIVLPVRRAAKLAITEAMSPDIPSFTKSNITKLSSRLSLSLRLAFRNFSRNRTRTVLTTIGLSLALVTPFALGVILSSTENAVESSFDLPGWDGTAVFDSFQEQNITIQNLENRDYIISASPVISWEINAFNERIIVVGSQYGEVFSLPTQNKFTEFERNNQIIVDSLFANRNNLELNDTFEASLLGQKKNLSVGAIHTQILGGAFMSLEGVQIWLHEWEDEIKALAANSSVLNETEIDKLPNLPNKPISGIYLTGDASKLSQESPDYMVAVIVKEDLKGQVDQLMALFTFFINLYYGLASVMAFLIIANTATINMLEREREMATLKTLGTSDVILSKATSIENFVMGTIAGISGIIIGYPVAIWLLRTFTYEIYYVPTYFPIYLPIMMIISVILLSILATIPSWLRLRRMNLGNLVRSIER
jgi:putative ABC transport system permease protein|tara:strand:- start:5676 stop:8123 length:2448 start_codon:yes stop_codon:yes gene_type:complete